MSYPYGPGQPEPLGPGQHQGGWGAVPPPPPGYGAPPPDYGAPPPDYGNPPPDYGAPPPDYGNPPGYGMPPGGWQPGGYQQPPPPPKKSSGGMLALITVGVVVLVAGVIVGAYFLARGSGNDKNNAAPSNPPAAQKLPGASNPPASQPDASGMHLKPGSYNSINSWSLWSKISDRTKDSRPMTTSEVLDLPDAKSQKDYKGNVFTLQNGRLDSGCAAAVWGPALQQALNTYGCTQVIRATYTSTNPKFTGQFAVFNLKDEASANQLLVDLDPQKGGKGFSIPLAANGFGKGATAAETGAYGHFVVIGWGSYTDGTNGSTASIDMIGPAGAVQQGGKAFLFHRNV